MSQPAVIVHGGARAGAVIDSRYRAEARIAGCREAAEKAYQVLKTGKSALDAGKLSGELSSYLQFFVASYCCIAV